MSRREDILGCIDVTIMDRCANSAPPSSYSKTFPAFGAGAAVTHAADLGGKRFVDFLEPYALALKHFGGQFVAVIENDVDFARQVRQPLRVLVLDPQALDANSGRSRTVHASRILKDGAQDMRGKRCKRTEMRDARRYPSPAFKAGVSREEL
jgi:hypothetical protein